MNREEMAGKYRDLPPDEDLNKPKNTFPDGKYVVQVMGVRENENLEADTISYSVILNVYQGPYAGSIGEEFYFISGSGDPTFTFQKMRWFLTAVGLENEDPFCLSNPDIVEAITGLLLEATLVTNKKGKRDKNGNLYKSWNYWQKCEAQPVCADDEITDADVDSAEKKLDMDEDGPF